MIEKNKKSERLSYMKEKIKREVFKFFQNGKDRLEVSRRINELLLRDIPQILDEYNIRGKEETVQDILHESLRDVYELDKTMDEKSLVFSDALSNTMKLKSDSVINSQTEELDYEFSDFKNRLNSEYFDRTHDIDEKTMRKENDFFTHEPDFKRNIRSYLMSQGINDEEMLNDIERRVKSTVGNIYDEYHDVDKKINSRIEDICDQEIDEYKRDVDVKETENKEQQTEDNSFINSLKNEVNSDEEIAKAENSEENHIKNKEEKSYDENSLPDNLLK